MKAFNIALGIGGAIETAIVPYHLIRLRASYPHIKVHCVLSTGAEQFVTKTALQAISGCEVCTKDTVLFSDGQIPHMVNSNRDLTVIFPATARIVAEAALGIVSCPVTRLFAFSNKKKLILTQFLHPAMEASLYLRHLETLKSIGCTVIEPQNESVWNRESAWVATGRAIRKFLGLDENVETATTLEVWRGMDGYSSIQAATEFPNYPE
jgi:phosphopantothenoylcysteine synthetase/decarboxylase